MKKALVFAGGGTRGAYQAGTVKAMQELGMMEEFSIMTGTSIGALNSTMLVQGDYDAFYNMWNTLTQDQIMNDKIVVDFKLETLINERNLLPDFVKSYVNNKGADIGPFYEMVHKLYHPEKFFASPIDFGCIAVKSADRKPIYVTKEMMKEHGEDWLISTASCFPAFPIHKFSEGTFIDGGYFDNLPIDYALQKGADEIVAIDLNWEPQHPSFMNKNHILYVAPSVDTGSFLSFDPERFQFLQVIGYNDMMKALGKYEGIKYTFHRFQTPKLFPQFYMECLKMETQIKLANGLMENIRSDTFLSDKLLKLNHRVYMNEKQFCLSMMDQLMELCGLKVEKVYKFEDAKKMVMAAFAEAAKQDYEVVPSLSLSSINSYLKSIDTKGIITKMIHQNLYPKDVVFSENLILTVYPFEQALANFVTLMMKGLK